MKRLELHSVSVKSRRALDCKIAAEGWVILLGRGIYWKLLGPITRGGHK